MYLIDVISPVLKTCPCRCHSSFNQVCTPPPLCTSRTALWNQKLCLHCRIGSLQSKKANCSSSSCDCVLFGVNRQTHSRGFIFKVWCRTHFKFIFSNLLKDKLNLTFPDCLLPSSKLSPPSLDRWSRASLRWSRGEHSCKPRSCRSREWTCLQKQTEDEVD